MIKKKNYILTIFISLLICCVMVFCPTFFNKTKTYAEEISKVNSQNCLTDFGIDSSLYKVLNKLAQHITNGENTIRDFDTNVFNTSVHDDSYYSPSSSNGNQILEDLEKGILNLSTGENAKYSCLKKSGYNIKYIGGLESLNLTNIHTLILDGNSISNIASDELSCIDNLTKLSVKDNNLKEIIIGKDITKLNEIDLSNNSIRKIDLSNLSQSASGEGPIVNLSCNNIQSLNDITFSSNVQLSKLDISFNNILNISTEDINNLNNNMTGDNTANILIQGFTDFTTLNAGDFITIYQSNNIDNFNIKFFYDTESSFYNQTGNNLICQSSGESIVEKIGIPAGKIKVGFYSGDRLITKEAFSHLNSSVIDKLTNENNNGKYSVPIKELSLKGFSDGKEINNFNQKTDIKVIMSIKNIDNIPNKEDILSPNGVKYFYYINSSNKLNGDTIEVNSNGKYNYNLYISFDGIESARTRIQIVRQDFSGITWGIVVLVIIFVLISAGFFIFRWFKNGAQVAPLSEKEIYRLNKRRGFIQNTVKDDDYISSLDAPRHETRVSDQNIKDDSIYGNLNSYNNDFSEEINPTNDFPQDIDDKN